MDAGTGADGDGRVLDDRVVDKVVDSSRHSMDQLNAIEQLVSRLLIRFLMHILVSILRIRKVGKRADQRRILP